MVDEKNKWEIHWEQYIQFPFYWSVILDGGEWGFRRKSEEIGLTGAQKSAWIRLGCQGIPLTPWRKKTTIHSKVWGWSKRKWLQNQMNPKHPIPDFRNWSVASEKQSNFGRRKIAASVEAWTGVARKQYESKLPPHPHFLGVSQGWRDVFDSYWRCHHHWLWWDPPGRHTSICPRYKTSWRHGEMYTNGDIVNGYLFEDDFRMLIWQYNDYDMAENEDVVFLFFRKRTFWER